MGNRLSRLRKWLRLEDGSSSNGNGHHQSVKRHSHASSISVSRHPFENGSKSSFVFRTPQIAAGANQSDLQQLQSKDVHENIFIALYDYKARTAEDLSFRKGDHMAIMDYDQGDWWRARLIGSKSGAEGYVPSNYVARLRSLPSYPWFFGTTRRAEAERLLLMPCNRHGSFLIRESESVAGNFSLSVRDNGQVKHYRVRKTDVGRFFISRRVSFSTLVELVAHYAQQADGLATKLTAECKQAEDTPPTHGLSHQLADQWEVDRSLFVMTNKLGEGQYGDVYEALWNDTIKVAIKTLKTDGKMNREEFLREAQIMKKLRHPKLVQLYAVCSSIDPIYIVTELMENGALNKYLQAVKDRIQLHELIYMAAQVASGMAYLESKKYVHRDLAARNILVGANNVCKVADFGFARLTRENIYETTPNAKFPVKWTAPEAALMQRFTCKSDVWSFGILLTEIIGKGRLPYPGMTNREVLDQVPNGYRMGKWPDCPDRLYDIMLACWHMDPLQRPTFETLQWQLDDFFAPDDGERYFDYTESEVHVR